MYGKLYILVIAAICSIVFRMQGFHSVSVALMLALFYFIIRYRGCKNLVIISVISLLFFYSNPLYFPQPPSLPQQSTVTGQVNTIPKFNGNKFMFTVKTAEKQTIEVVHYPKTTEELEQLQGIKYGFTCALNGSYRLPSEARNYYGFHYREYLALKKIYFQFQLDSYSVEQCRDGPKSAITFLQRYRQLGIEYSKDHLPARNNGLLISLIFGDRSDIEPEILQLYQTYGIVHLLAISGLHVGLVSGFAYYLFIRLGLTRERAIDLLLTLLPFYTIIAGAAPPVVRASAMLALVLISLRISIKLHPLDGISLVCFVLLVLNPSFVFQLAFQLSFLISYVLIISAKTILLRYLSWFSRLFVITVIAQLASFPLLLYHFYEISPWSILLNLFFIPFISLFALPFSFAIFISYFFVPAISHFLLVIFDVVMIAAHNGLELAHQFLPLSTLIFGKPPLLIIVFYYAAIALFFVIWEKSRTHLEIVKGALLFFAVALLHWNLPYFSKGGEITFLDVGQGDSIYIELPRRKAVYLIDTGGKAMDFFSNELTDYDGSSFDVGKDVLVPFLKAKGVRKINKLLLTHGHYDHIGGAEALIGEIFVQALLYGEPSSLSEYEKQLLAQFRANGSELVFVKEGDGWKTEKNKFLILSPTGNEQTTNNRSIVLYALINDKSWLFLGDLEADGEQRLLQRYPQLEINMLKLAHHGSKTSTSEELLTALKPSYGFISAGKNNLYGHPHAEILQRLAENNVIVYRTDLHGAIRYRFWDNHSLIETVIDEKNN